MFNSAIENWQNAMAQQNAKEQAADKKTASVPNSTDAIMTPDFVDKVIDDKLKRMDEAAARKEAARAADKAEAAAMMGEIAVLDALDSIPHDNSQQ
jgi:hypothetical protein